MSKNSTRILVRKYVLSYLCILPFLVTFADQHLIAQNISFNEDVPTGITVCGTSETFTVEFTNISAGTLSNVLINVNMPNGINYESGSIIETSSSNIQEQNISDLTDVYFSCSNLAASATVSFTFRASADFDAYNLQNSGGVFNNVIAVSYDGGSDQETTPTYNVLYAALSITTVSPTSETVFVGGSYTRAVTIVNGGYGSITSFVLEDIHDSNSTISSVDIGVLNGAASEITISAADFTSIGNGDASFDQNEAITITETIYVSGCNSFESTLTAIWGCTGQTTSSNQKFPYTTVQLFAPDLSITATPSFNTCVEETADAQQLTITNNGTGPANALSIEIAPSHQKQYNRVDISSIEVVAGSVTTSLTPTATQAATAYDCLGTDPKDGFTVTLPTIQPGETVYLNWDHYTCTATYCGDVRLIGWEYEASYTDMCNSNNYSDDGDGQAAQRKNVSTFFESPSDLVDAQEGVYSLILSSATFNLPEEAGAYFEVEFDVPLGLVWNGTPQDLDLSYTSGGVAWTPDQVAFNNTTRKLTAQYLLPIPDGFNLTHSIFNLTLSADCSEGVDWVTVGGVMYYVIDPSCDPIYRMPLTCYESATTQLHCPGDCEHGLAFNEFRVERTSLGISDNDRDGLPDATNSLDYTKIKTNRVMVSDTFQTVFEGTVHTSATYPSWSYAYARSEVPYGDEIVVLSASVSIYDASTGQTLVCDGVNYADVVSNGKRVVDFDFGPLTLASSCSAFSGFVLEDEDEVTLTATYKVASNPGGMNEQVTIENDFYVSNTANGTGFQCNDWNGNFTLIGYFYRVNNSEQYNVKTCTKTIKQNYKMSIGACCTNYSGGNIFPYEYRNWAHIKNLRVDVPAGYSFVSGQIEQWRTEYENNTKKETDQITPDSVVGTIHYFNLENYHVDNGGALNYSDDGFNGRVSLEVQPICTVNEAANYPMTWYYTFGENDVLGGAETSEYTATADYLKYFRADLKLSTTQQTQDATYSTVSWDVKVKCNTADAENAWLHLDYLTNEMSDVEVFDVSADTAIILNNDIYPIGAMSQNATRTYRVTVNYNSCSISNVKVISGYDCTGYPGSYSANNCSTEELTLYVAPQPAELQVKFNSQVSGADVCSDSISVELEMLSAKLSNVENLFVQVIQPNSGNITMIPGTVEALYPNTGSYSTIADPTLNTGTYTITGADMDATIGTDGLVGITDVTANIVKLKFDLLLAAGFKPGDFVTIQIGGDEPCGDALPTLSLRVDPNASFGRTSSIGLGGTENDWAMAWGDYDNDGYVDLFVSNNSVDQPNRLYHNDGDGTFTQITTGDIATDQAASLGATWGDYDNDGDIDLYVANNIGSNNFLYRNNGDGTFAKVLNDPIVSYDGYSHGVSWGDYDNDGYLDMFVAEYFTTKFNKLYHNNGDGTFTDAGTSAPTLDSYSSIAGVWGDYDNDGDVDLFVANINNENNALYKNIGNGDFEKITTGAIVTDGGKSVGASWGDYTNDGYLDLFVSNAGDQDNFLYENNGDGTFTKITSGAIVTDGGHSHGSAWGDFDNDGDLDLMVGNDADGQNFFYSNNGDGTFTKLTNAITEDEDSSFGVAWADIDNDLDIDLFIVNREGDESLIYSNERGICQNKACVTLVGSNSNRSAIGTKVRLKATIYGQAVWQMREISGQTGGGIGGQNEFKQIFGLGDATIVDSMIIEWPSGYTQILTNQPIDNCNAIVEDAGGKICGVAYYDQNNNCVQDAGEPGIPNIDLLIQPGDYIVTTNDTGAYFIYLAPDTYTVTPVSNSTWDQDCTTSHSVDVLAMGVDYCGNDFAYSPLNPSHCLSVEITNTPHRVGFQNLTALTYCNTGTETATNAQLTMSSDASVTFNESSLAWDNYDGTTATWNLGTLDLSECNTIYVKGTVSSDVQLGAMITFDARISSDELTGACPDSIDQTVEPAVGAFDPNDIAVSPEGYIDNDQELVYTIRFQNVGNALVSNVRVRDQLPAGLDVSTLEMGVASHPYQLDVQDDHTLVWTFENINMPDSLTNEPESHGYITFKIRPKAALEDGTTISNAASIFFDFNDPIHTNVVTNTIGKEPERTLVGPNSPNLSVVPNPTIGRTIVRVVNDNQQPLLITGMIIHNIIGEEIYRKEGLRQDEFIISKGTLETGIYIIKAFGEDDKAYLSKLIVH